jgi:hypothetical protein
MSDPVNHPAHYTQGKYEAIDVIEDAVARAPDPVRGALQWQVLKYTLRMWDKYAPLEDAKKARWYLDRLIHKLESNREESTERPNPYVPRDR